MAKKNNITKIDKKGHVSTFEIVGKAKVTDYTFAIDEKSKRSDYTYSRLNLLMDCGDKYGSVSSQMMGGYGDDSVIMVSGRDEDGKNDYKNRFEVAWDDRFNENILEQVASTNFIRVGIEKDKAGKVFVKKFISPYDAITYLKEHLTDGMTLRVKGNLRYSLYNETVQVNKDINAIYLADHIEEIDFKPSFQQSILIDKDCVSDIDKETGVVTIDAIVLDYMKALNGVEIKGMYPYRKTFEYQLNLDKPELIKKQMDLLFKVKKDYTLLQMEGVFIESGASIRPKFEDLSDEFKELITLGIYTEDDLLDKLATNGSKSKRMVMVSPVINKDADGNIKPWKVEESRTEEDLFPEYILEAINADGDEDDDFENEEEVIPKTESTKKVDEVGDEHEEDEESDDEVPDWLKDL